jgi:F-type H+-transporting ATPase subunit b
MEKILSDLGELLLKAVPTFLLVGLLYVYLRWMFFGPLERVLEKRRQATEGARKLAEETFAKAAQSTAQYEAALRAARAEIYQEQEQARRRFEQELGAAVQEAKRGAAEQIEESARRLAAEVAEAKRGLALQAASLAARMVERVLARRAA